MILSPAGHYSSFKLSRVVHRSFLVLCGLSLLTSTIVAQNTESLPTLEVGKPIERELGGDAAHSYSITLAANQFLHVVVEQKGIDVVVTLFVPDGKKLIEVDSPNGSDGPEPVSIVTEIAGSYRLEVRSLEANAPTGRYQVKVEELRMATSQDKSRMAAQEALAEASQFSSEGNATSVRKAIDKYHEALPLLRAVNDRANEAATLTNIASAYDSLGDKQKALDYNIQALPLMRATGNRNGEAVTLNNIGSVYGSLGEKQKALDYYNQALLLFRAHGDRGNEAIAIGNIGKVYDTLGERQKALDYFNQALPLFRAIGDRRSEAVTLTHIGVVYAQSGEPQKALEYYQQALPLRHATGDRRGEAYSLTNIGIVYDALGENQKALDYYNQALLLMRAVGDRGGEAYTLSNIGVTYDKLGERQKTLDYLNQALPLFRAVGDRGGEASTLSNLGSLYDSTGEKQKALDYLNQALPLNRAIGARGGEAQTLNNIGMVYDSIGERQKAVDYLNQALPLRRAVGDRQGEAYTLANIASVERNRGNLTSARALIEEAITIVESQRTKIASKELRSSYFATVQQFYDCYIDILMRLHKQQPSAGHDGAALQASERGRARSLLETLVEAGADIRQGVDPKLVARERSLQQQLNAKAQEQTRLLNGKHTEAQTDRVAKEIESLSAEYQLIEGDIRQKSPIYAALTQPQPLTLKDIQTLVLDDDTLLLEYSLGDPHSYLWAATPTSITGYELPGRSEIENSARLVYDLLNARNAAVDGETEAQRNTRVARADAQYAGAATRLSQLVLAPVSGQLAGKRLLVVANGALQYIPFAALPDPTKTRFARPTLLVVRHEIVSVPSASTLAVLRKEIRGRMPRPKTVAILADPVFESDDVRVRESATISTRANANNASSSKKRELPFGMERSAEESGTRRLGLAIPRLPGTRNEANQILALAPASERMGAFDFVANRQTATGGELSQYRYIHFATHGFLNSVHPELSGLVFSMVDEKGQPQDGFLRSHEIFNLKLPAELVVLSACQTGLGKEIKGEGLVGLTRGFMYAGSPRVVVSLWSVSDQATAELMTRFYRGMLKEKLRPAAALRAAQVSLMKEKKWESPFYWAAFTLQGEWR